MTIYKKMNDITFELSRLSSYDNESILTEIKRVAALIDSPALTQSEFDKHSKVHSGTVRRRFGGWRKALMAAGLADRYSGPRVSAKMKTQAARSMSRDELVVELKRVASQLSSQTLTVEQFNDYSHIAASAISRRFGSWNMGLQAAGLKPVNMGRRYTEEDYFENLLSVWTYLGRQPKYREMNNPPSFITGGAYEKRWGSWSKALVAFVDRVNSDLDRPVEPPQARDFQKEEVQAPALPKPEDVYKIPLGLRYNVLRRDRFKCVLCGNSPAIDPKCKLHIDHIVPFSKGGRTIATNLRTLCAECNVGKSSKTEAI